MTNGRGGGSRPGRDMEHADARELIELAAVEPGGLERLMAGEGVESTPLAEHLAGCAECAAEVEAVRRSTTVIGDVIRTSPPADLRDRTLAYVAEVGRARPRQQAAAPGTDASARSWSLPSLRDWRSLAGPGMLAAAILVAIVGTGWIVGNRIDARLAEADAAIAEQRGAIAGLTMVADWTLRLSADPDVGRARLQPPGGEAAGGTVLFSTDTQELVMVASGLARPGAGREYRCWVELDGQRQPIGRMYFAGELAYWVGQVDELTRAEGPSFGVSLVDASNDDLSGEVVLLGET